IRYMTEEPHRVMQNKTSFDFRNWLSSVLPAFVATGLLAGHIHGATTLPTVPGVELQPLSAQVKRLTEAMEFVGSSLSDETKKALDAAIAERNAATASEKIQAILDPLCLFGVSINP